MKKGSRKKAAPPNRLRELRVASGWSMLDVAGFVNCTESLVSLHERGKRRLTERTVEGYMRLFNVTATELFNEVYDDGEVGSPVHHADVDKASKN